jgi:ribosomal protein S27E
VIAPMRDRFEVEIVMLYQFVMGALVGGGTVIVYRLIRNCQINGRFFRVECPQCHAVQPWWRYPATLKDWVFGRFVCKVCGSRMDTFGRSR